MPERWEREVEKLGAVTAPKSIRTRIAEGRQGDGMPPAPRRGQRIVAAVVAFAVFGAAVVLIAIAFRGRTPVTLSAADPGTTVIVRLGSDDEGPTASLSYGGDTAQPQYGSYCWNGTTTCVDTALSPFRAADFVEVPSGTPIVIDHDAALDGATVWIVRGDDPNRVDTGPIEPVSHIDGQVGRYILTVSAAWPLGRVQYYFPIEIVAATSHVPSPEASGLTAVLRAPADGSMPVLTITYRGDTQRFFAQDGRWPGVDAFPLPLQGFDASIDPGTTISIDGDADRVEGTLFIAEADQTETGGSIPLDLRSGSTTLPDGAGYFRLVLVGTWPDGEAGFNVGITLGTPPSDWPPPPSIAPVPDVVGLTQNEAVARLTAAGFVSVSVATPAGQSGGSVTSQDPAAGVQARTTTTVRLTVSTTG